MSANAAGAFRTHKADKLLFHFSNEEPKKTNSYHKGLKASFKISGDPKSCTFEYHFQILLRKTGFSTVGVNANFLFMCPLPIHFQSYTYQLKARFCLSFTVDNAPRNDVCNEKRWEWKMLQVWKRGALRVGDRGCRLVSNESGAIKNRSWRCLPIR